jgi:uncharacterized protein YjiS (DUF1127 family)
MEVIATGETACPSAEIWSPLPTLHRWWRVRRTLLALAALDDAILKDIGVYRYEIDAIAQGTV